MPLLHLQVRNQAYKMRVHVGLFLLAVGLAGVHAQVAGTYTGETVLPVSTAMDAGHDTFVKGETTGICACGAGAATPECKAAVEVLGKFGSTT